MNAALRRPAARPALSPLAWLIAGLFPAGAWAADEAALTLAPVVMTATRIEQSSFDVPVSIDVISGEQLREGQFQVNASESLSRIPGIVAPNQYRLSSDQQVSSRGFGARSAFGIRGIRVYADGIPLSMPDGQGQSGSFSLGSADRLEVMRGPFSTLYGNSSGGVIQLFTQDGPARPTVTANYYAGSFNTWRSGLQLGGQQGKFNYLVDLTRYETAGYRDHSAARRDQFNGKFSYRPGDDTRLTLILNALDQPYNEDPQGLTRAQMAADPRQAAASAATFNTGGSKRQTHAGLNLEHRVDQRNSFAIVAHAGQREVFGRLGITGAGPTSSGGISVVDRNFSGVDARWTHKLPTAAGLLTLTGGIEYQYMKDVRKGYVNNNGEQGDLRRDEDNIVRSTSQYLQAEWLAGEHWVLTGGLRHSSLHFAANDRYINGGNPDDSGSINYSNTSPVFGLLYRLTPTVNLYANYGKGFETPTFIELAYRPVGSGLNFALQPSTSRNAEAGIKAVIGDSSRLNLAVFDIRTDNEIVTGVSLGGRNTYRNAGRTRRQGVELSFDSQLPGNLNLYLAYALLDARFEDAFLSGNGAGTVNQGNRLPGAPRISGYGELSWQAPSIGFTTALEARYSGKVYVNDLNSDAADSYAVVNWRAGFEQKTGSWRFKEFVRIENLADKRYVGGVSVNDANERYFAPAPGRNYMAGVSASYTF